MQERSRRFAEQTAHAVGSHWAFLLALVTVAVWALTGPYFHYSDTWQLVINTGTTLLRSRWCFSSRTPRTERRELSP